MATQAKHVLIDIEDCKQQLFHRFEVNGVVVLVDGTPEDDPAIGQTIDLLLAAPDLVAALEAFLQVADHDVPLDYLQLIDILEPVATQARDALAKAKPKD